MKKLLAAAWVVLVAWVGTSQAVSTATFTMTTSGTNWYLYCSVDNNSSGLASFQLDLYGTYGTQILTSVLKAPRFLDANYDFFIGFSRFTSGGVVVGGNVTGIGGGQDTPYGDVNNPAKDALVIKGIGQVAGSDPNSSKTWGAQCLLAQGTFTGPGTFRCPNLEASLLSKVNGGAWVGPGNVEAANIFNWGWSGCEAFAGGPYTVNPGGTVQFAGGQRNRFDDPWQITDTWWTIDNSSKTFENGTYSYDAIVNTLGMGPGKHFLTYHATGLCDRVVESASALATFTVTPEPASLSLLGLGCLAMLRRRRGCAA